MQMLDDDWLVSHEYQISLARYQPSELALFLVYCYQVWDIHLIVYGVQSIWWAWGVAERDIALRRRRCAKGE
jgi:hypothetical protein